MRMKKPKTNPVNDWQSIRTYVPYAVTFLIGLFIQPIIYWHKGWEHSIDGKDLLMGLLYIVMVWSFKGSFLTERKNKK